MSELESNYVGNPIAAKVSQERPPSYYDRQTKMDVWKESYGKELSVDEVNKLYDFAHNGPGGEFMKWQLAKILVAGSEKVREDIVSAWTNLAAVAGFVGAIGMSILLSSLGKSEGFDSNGDLINLSRAYYIFWGLATFSELCSLLLLLIITLHSSMAIRPLDFLNFMKNWEMVIRLPETFTAVGCYAMNIAACLGVFVIADSVTGWIVTTICFCISALVTVIWVSMIGTNVKMASDGAEIVIEAFKNSLKE